MKIPGMMVTNKKEFFLHVLQVIKGEIFRLYITANENARMRIRKIFVLASKLSFSTIFRRNENMTIVARSCCVWCCLSYKRLIKNNPLQRDTVVSTNKRSQVNLTLKYLEAVTTMYTLQSLHQVQPMSAGVALHSASTGQPELSSPYWSLNTALLASQPYTRRSRISRLAPVLIKALSSYIKFESRSP